MKHLYITAKTTDGKDVVGGVFSFYETEGIPLDSVFTCLKEKNLIPDWIEFYKAAVKSGMSAARVLSKLEEAISDSFGVEMSTHVISVLQKLST